MTRHATTFDAIIIGGGPAGLSAAIYLGRFRRRVLLIDDGDSRAARIPCSHNYPGFPNGIAGASLLTAMRQQAERYGTEFCRGHVETLKKTASGFVAKWNNKCATGRLALLATGASDMQPAMPHLLQALHEGHLRYCPVCDGFECIGKRVGVITDSASGVAEALYVRHFADCVALFFTRPLDLTDEQATQLANAGIGVEKDPLDSIALGDDCVALRHGEATSEYDTVYCSLGLRVHSDLAKRLGAHLTEEDYLVADEHYATTVDGLYCAGDVARGLNQIAVATGGAAIAASAMHRRLMNAAAG